jgi:F0F1-type ATP synthase membrane subunit c/vacuolar-type H+-ATPase subunit K
MRVEPGAQVGVEAAGVVMGAAVVVARVVGVWVGVGLGRVEAETAAAAARRRERMLVVILVVFWVSLLD